MQNLRSRGTVTKHVAIARKEQSQMARNFHIMVKKVRIIYGIFPVGGKFTIRMKVIKKHKTYYADTVEDQKRLFLHEFFWLVSTL